jgi:hypothetical protein
LPKTLRRITDIEASKERVWDVLADFSSYPEWNPFIKRISGEPTVGAQLEARLEPPGGKGITIRPKVLSAAPGQELKWLGHLLIPGIFDGEHHFLIQDLGQGRTRFIQQEVFKGVLVPLTGRILEKTGEGFEQMNKALKERAEKHPAN